MKTTMKIIKVAIFMCLIFFVNSCASSKTVSDDTEVTYEKNVLPPDVKSNKYAKSRNL